MQTTNLTFVGKKLSYKINSYNIQWFQVVSDTKYNIECGTFYKKGICNTNKSTWRHLITHFGGDLVALYMSESFNNPRIIYT